MCGAFYIVRDADDKVFGVFYVYYPVLIADGMSGYTDPYSISGVYKPARGVFGVCVIRSAAYTVEYIVKSAAGDGFISGKTAAVSSDNVFTSAFYAYFFYRGFVAAVYVSGKYIL